MYFLLNEEGLIINANETALRLLGYSAREVLNNRFSDLLFPESILKTEHAFSQCLLNKTAASAGGRIRKGNHGHLDVVIRFTPVPNTSGDCKEITLVQLHDVTKELQDGLALKRFQYVTENTVNPIQITDLNGKMIYVNPAFERFSGYSKEELMGNDPSIFSSGKHSKGFWTRMWDIITTGKAWQGEIENKRKDESIIHSNLLISPIMNEHGIIIGYFGVHSDITDRRNLEKQLIHTQKMESIGTLAAGVAHEVGNPLASISAIVQIIQRSTEDSFIRDKLELVKNQITRISKIIRDLVDFSRPSNYELKLTDINANLKEAVEIVRVGTKAKSLDFIMELSSEVPMLPLVSDQIQQVFVNILINAVDAITDQAAKIGTAFKGSIVLETYLQGDFVYIIMQDNGTGIPEEFVTKIFEPFFTTKKEGKGTGLGLWVSYGIIKNFQGDIEAKRVSPHGTKFKIRLPINPLY